MCPMHAPHIPTRSFPKGSITVSSHPVSVYSGTRTGPDEDNSHSRLDTPYRRASPCFTWLRWYHAPIVRTVQRPTFSARGLPMSRHAIYWCPDTHGISAVVGISASTTREMRPCQRHRHPMDGRPVRWNIPDEVANYQLSSDGETSRLVHVPTSTHLIRHLAGGYTLCAILSVGGHTAEHVDSGSQTRYVPTSTPIPTAPGNSHSWLCGLPLTEFVHPPASWISLQESARRKQHRPFGHWQASWFAGRTDYEAKMA